MKDYSDYASEYKLEFGEMVKLENNMAEIGVDSILEYLIKKGFTGCK